MRCSLEQYDFYNPIFYTEQQADDISIAMHGVLVDRKPVSSLVSNKTSFLKKLEEIVDDDAQPHYLSFKRVSNGRFSLHLDPYSGYVNLGKFEVDPDLVTAIYLKDNDAFEHFAFEEVENRFHLAMERVAQGTYKYDTKVANDHIRKRFDLRNFPEVEILQNVVLDADAYTFLKDAKQELDEVLSKKEYKLSDAFASLGSKFADCYDFASIVEDLYLDHLDTREEQIAFFEMSFMVDDDDRYAGSCFLMKSGRAASDSEVSPKTSSSLFCIRTNTEVASDYDHAVQTGTTCMMQDRFIDMFEAAIMSVVQNFEKNCVLVEEKKNSPAQVL